MILAELAKHQNAGTATTAAFIALFFFALLAYVASRYRNWALASFGIAMAVVIIVMLIFLIG